MKLRDILDIIKDVGNSIGVEPKICGGVARDRVLNLLKPGLIEDLDITTCNKLVHNLSTEVGIKLGEVFAINSKRMDDGHTSIFLNSSNNSLKKIDFSSNFVVPNIDKILYKINVKPSDVAREMYSRDFTINSMLLDFDFKTITDPTNAGIEDCNKKIIKTCLDPNITFGYNHNRLVRVIYLAAKLGFDVDPKIISFMSSNHDMFKSLPKGYVSKHIKKALSYDPDKAVWIINKTNLWTSLPIIEEIIPYYKQKSITAQLKKNFDYGSGLYSNLDKYDSVMDFRKKRMKSRKKILNKIREMKLK